MGADEYMSKRRTWVREVLIGLAVSLGSDLVLALAQVVVHRLG